MQDHDDFLEDKWSSESGQAVAGRNCCNKAFEVRSLSSSCRAGVEEGSCLAVLGQVGAQVPKAQACKVDAAAGCQPSVQVCKITAHAQGPPPLASRGCDPELVPGARPRSGRPRRSLVSSSSMPACPRFQAFRCPQSRPVKMQDR